MTFVCREIHQSVNKRNFQRELTGQNHMQQTVNDLLFIVIGKQCQKN